MPEGDSVYRLARRLDESLRGAVLRAAELRVPRWATAELAGRTVRGHDTRGKHLLTRLDNDLTLHTHLRMDGSWTVMREGRHLPARLHDDVRVLLRTTGGPSAYGLRLPVVELFDNRDEAAVLGHLGPDPLQADWDAAEAAHRLATDPSRPLADALLDQRLVAGLGNLWANELCFLRGHSPWTPVGDIDVAALVRLAARALRVSATVEGMHQITTGNRRRGERHWVAGRAGRPCLRCGVPVQVSAETGEQRRTWWCPNCQPGPSPDLVRYSGPRADRRGA